MIRRIFIALFSLTVTAGAIMAADPMATRYPAADCQGSLKPYPAPTSAWHYPDSLTPVYISHVGRHGSRYPASSTNTLALQNALLRADSAKTITQLGRRLLNLTRMVVAQSNGRWGALDSLGMAEQRGIASRMLANFPQPFRNGAINALSSYSPRAMMSMFSFVHQLDRLNNSIEVTTSTGRRNSALMRPFDTDADYKEYIADGKWHDPYDSYFAATVNGAAIERALGKDYPYDGKEPRDLELVEYYVVAGMGAMGVTINPLDYFTIDEYNALWSVFNLRQYLQRVATTLSTAPADIASSLVLDIIARADGFIDGTNQATVDLRFGHAETLMPLLSLLRLPGCYYLTNYFDTVAMHWRDFEVVPMAANLQMVMFKSAKGRYYVSFALNEKPIAPIPNDSRVIIPWNEARDYMTRCVPLYRQP